jgi:2-keto-4-pentenoate hydratase/2-oxohepta-3-ene-1,7-dioic acid hydratase in catechol pathway
VASDPPEVDYECELAVVIGRDCRNARKETALEYVLGYTIANDVTARRYCGTNTRACFLIYKADGKERKGVVNGVVLRILIRSVVVL